MNIHDFGSDPVQLPTGARLIYPRTDADSLAEFAERFGDDLAAEDNIIGLARGEQRPDTVRYESTTPVVVMPIYPRIPEADGCAENNTQSVSEEKWTAFMAPTLLGRDGVSFLGKLARRSKQ